MTRPTWLDCDHIGIGLPGCPTCDGREDWRAWRCVAGAARDYILAVEERAGYMSPAVRAQPAALAFAREVAPGLAWQVGEPDAFAELPTGRAIAGDGTASVCQFWVAVVVGGYRLHHDYSTRPLTVAEARHVLHDFGQRLARSTLDYRRAAGMAILVGMGK